jgi:CheY-like chemotaxis protein
VLTADGGRAALALLEEGEQAFDVILCDLLMHGMNGMELHAELDRRWPGLSGRIVFMTGGAFTEAAQDFLARVPNTCIQKPFDLRALRSAIKGGT